MTAPLKLIILLSLAVATAGCATDRTFGDAPDVEVTDLTELPAPRGEAFYTVGAQEKLAIVVVGSEELSGTYLTNEFGNLQFPLVGEVPTSGLEPGVAADMIEQGLRGRFVLDPQVRVVPEEFPSPSISVGGEVEEPGSFSSAGNPTLLRIINRAGGLGPFAQLDDVLVMRTVDGQKFIGIYNLRAIQRGNYPDPTLYANDVVMVGDSPARRRLQSIVQFLPLLTSSAIIIDRLGR
ncbi:hypothetical protein BPTFM16_02125 [Altererythrobacter insulae]|nr:hypothetical protein BPTFM16_02125 [Altererythrobacter insulae]